MFDKRDYLNFPIVIFPSICSNIPAAPAYGIYVSQLIRYSRACGSHSKFLASGFLLDISSWSHLFKSFMVVTMTWLQNMSVTNDNGYVPFIVVIIISSSPACSGVRVARFLVFCVMFVDHFLSFFFWPLHCLFNKSFFCRGKLRIIKSVCCWSLSSGLILTKQF